jgi:uncharacterized protein YbjT (DUF2867 family)
VILVVGATGRVGNGVVRTLAALGLDVRALARKGSNYYWLNDTGCRFHFGDLRDARSLLRACTGAEYVVASASVRLETRDNNHTTVTIDGYRSLFEAAASQGVRRVVLVSCAGVDQDRGLPSFRARRQAEERLAASGLDFTILRAPLHEVPFLDMAWRLKDGKGPVALPGPGDQPLRPLPCVDLARMAAASLDLDAVRNQIVPVAGSVETTARAAFELACEVLGVEPRARVMPASAVRLMSGLGRPEV